MYSRRCPINPVWYLSFFWYRYVDSYVVKSWEIVEILWTSLNDYWVVNIIESIFTEITDHDHSSTHKSHAISPWEKALSFLEQLYWSWRFIGFGIEASRSWIAVILAAWWSSDGSNSFVGGLAHCSTLYLPLESISLCIIIVFHVQGLNASPRLRL